MAFPRDPLLIFKINQARRAAQAQNQGFSFGSPACLTPSPSLSTYGAVVFPSRGYSGIIFGV